MVMNPKEQQPTSSPMALIQKQITEDHLAFQKALTESHQTYLHASEKLLESFAAEHVPDADGGWKQEFSRYPAGQPEEEILPPAVPLPPLQENKEEAAPSEDGSQISTPIGEIMLAVVAEKTGYPVEILDPELDLESGLGIDSIKRVEILAAVQEKLGDLPDLDNAAMARLRTLKEIIVFLEENAKKKVAAKVIKPPAGKPPELFYLRCRQVPLPGFEVPGLRDAPVYINNDPCGLAEKLRETLQERGMEAIVADKIPSFARNVIYLGLADAKAPVDTVIHINEAAFMTARNIAAGMEQEGGNFFTVQSTGGDFGLTGGAGNQAWSAGLAALAKTAAREWPKAHAKALDMDIALSPEAMAKHIGDELCCGGLEKEIGYSANGRRITPVLVQAVREERRHPGLAPHDTVLVSGGGRGVTADALLALAKRQPLRFILLDRTPLTEEAEAYSEIKEEKELIRLLFAKASRAGETPAPLALKKKAGDLLAAGEIKANILRLTRAGSEACYLAVDITDEQALEQALLPVRRAWGNIRGIIHGAEVLTDRRIKDKGDGQFQQVFFTKVKGLQTLLKVTEKDELKLLACFSSIVAREGNAGQSDYAMASEILNKVCQRQKKLRDSLLVKSFNWGPWEGGMVSEGLKKHFEARGICFIPRETEAELFAREVCEGNAHAVEVVAGMVSPRTGLFIAQEKNVFSMRLPVDPRENPLLNDHQIQEHWVVPIVLVHEWFHRFARSLYPEVQNYYCTDLRVLKGIRVPKTQQPLTTWTIKGHILPEAGTGKESPVRLALQLEDQKGIPYYSGVLLPGKGKQSLEAANYFAATDAVPWEIKSEDIYGKYLFHGPSFQVLEALDSVHAGGGAGRLKRRPARDRKAEFVTAPMLMDGGLQLARLWGYRYYDLPSLPMRIGGLYLLPDGRKEETAVCRLAVLQQNDSRFIADIGFFNGKGECFAWIEKVEMYFLPSGRMLQQQSRKIFNRCQGRIIREKNYF